MNSNKSEFFIKDKKLTPKAKKIITAVAISLTVSLFFIWLGVGMYLSVPAEERQSLLPMYFMYSVFPLLIIFFGAKRIYIIVNFGDDPEKAGGTENGGKINIPGAAQPSANLTVRPYEKKDFRRLAEIYDGARKAELGLAGLKTAFVPLKEAAKKEGLFDYKVDVALADEKVAGFSAYNEEKIAFLYVDPEYTHRGVGSRLVAAAVENEKGISTAQVLEGNVPARSLFEKAGFGFVSTEYITLPGNESFKVKAWRLKRQTE